MWPFNSPCHETIRNHRTCVHVCTPAKGELQCLGDGHQFKYLNLSLEIVQVFYYMHTCRFLFCCFWPSLQNFQNKKFFQPKYDFFFSLKQNQKLCTVLRLKFVIINSEMKSQTLESQNVYHLESWTRCWLSE